MTEKEEAVSAPLDRDLQAHLGRQLRRLFNETAAEPVPDRFVDLLERLDREAPRPPQPGQARAQEAL
jgi:hypothetical protein